MTEHGNLHITAARTSNKHKIFSDEKQKLQSPPGPWSEVTLARPLCSQLVIRLHENYKRLIPTQSRKTTGLFDEALHYRQPIYQRSIVGRVHTESTRCLKVLCSGKYSGQQAVTDSCLLL